MTASSRITFIPDAAGQGAIDAASGDPFGGGHVAIWNSHTWYMSEGLNDGYLGGVPGIRAGKMYEIVKYLVVPAGLTGHATTSYQMNLKVFNTLPKDLQDILVQSQRDAEKVYRAAQKKDYFASFDELNNVGVVIEKAAMDVKTPEWRQWYEATKHLGEKLKEEIGSQLFDITLKVRGGK